MQEPRKQEYTKSIYLFSFSSRNRTNESTRHFFVVFLFFVLFQGEIFLGLNNYFENASGQR
jgi:hypothetical protein